jgi:hypothetical protein
MKFIILLTALGVIGCSPSASTRPPASFKFGITTVTCKSYIRHNIGYDLWNCDDGTEYKDVINVRFIESTK